MVKTRDYQYMEFLKRRFKTCERVINVLWGDSDT